MTEHLQKFGPTGHLILHEGTGLEENPRGWRTLIRKPIVRQWYHDGKIHREAEERIPSRFELFSDLLFVGIIHQLADIAAEHPNGPSVARFILTFFPSWSMWLDARNFFNVSGQDDVFQRFWLLTWLLCLVGYSVNASSIETSSDSSSAAAVAEHFVNIVRAAAEAAPEAAAEVVEKGVNPVRAAVAFFLVAKSTRVVGLLSYAYALPNFRISHISMAAQCFAGAIIYLPLIWVTNLRTQIILASLGIFIDYLLKYGFGIWVIWTRREERLREGRAASRDGLVEDGVSPGLTEGGGEGEDDPQGKGKGRAKRALLSSWVPAINIEHQIERTSAFVIITLGEFVVNLLYTNTTASIGIKMTYGRSALSLMTAFFLNWLYFAPGDSGAKSYEHAARRNWFTSTSFTALHWPLCASIILASASSKRMVTDNDVDGALMWYWGAGIGFALVFMVLIDLCHRDLTPTRSQNIARPVRSVVMLLGGLILILVPLASDHLTSLELLGITVGVLAFLVAFDFYARLCGLSEKPADKVGETEEERRRERLEDEDEEVQAADLG